MSAPRKRAQGAPNAEKKPLKTQFPHVLKEGFPLFPVAWEVLFQKPSNVTRNKELYVFHGNCPPVMFPSEATA